MKSNPWKLVTVVLVLAVLIPGLTMLLAGCGPDEEEEVAPTPVSVKPTATPVPAAPPADTPAPSPALSEAEGEAEGEAEEPVPPPEGSVVDDFEDGDFDDRWWSYIEEGSGSFACTPDQPGHASTQAIRLTFELGADGYAGCGIDIDPGQWADAGGLSFFWRADQPGLTVNMGLEMEDPTQTNPEVEGITPFQAELQTPGEEWTPAMLTWNAFAKVEWVGESGVDVIDPTRIVALYFEVVEEQSGSVWFDDLQRVTGVEEEAEGPVPPPAETGEASPEPPVADKWNLWVGDAHLRGVNMHPCDLFTEGGCVHPITHQDIQDLRDLGANLINASYPGVFTEEAPYEVNPTALAYLDELIGWAEEVGLYVVIHFRTGPGRNEGAILMEGDPNFAVWNDQAAHDAWVEMWRFTAERYRHNPVVAGYDLMVEPHPNTLIDPDGELEPLEVQAQAAGTLLDWNALAAEITAAIRQVDTDTPIIVSSISWASVEWFSALQPTGDSRTVYSLHAYEPDVYIIQEEGETTIGYPDVVDDYGEMITFDRAWLDENYRPAREFAQQHNVPIYIGEFGAVRWVPDAAAFLQDQTDLFEQYGWSYAIYVWRGDEPYFDGFNMEYGPDPTNHAPILDNPLLGVLRERWAQNVDFPGSPSFGAEPAEGEAEEPIPPPAETSEAEEPTATPPQAEPVIDKWALWVDGPHLRGANIWQAIVIPELDGLEFKGSGAVGPPYTQEDFNRLAAMGANYVSISGPGLFTETPPYTVDPGVQAHLDNLLAMIAEADMFATISFRTGPGRSEFGLCCGGDPYFEGYFNDTMWEDQAAQDAWVEMWRHTAERYRDNPIVAGYKLMVEPNVAGGLFEIYDPDEFYAGYANTLYDWNQLYPRLVAGIREVDPDTPILVGGEGWSGVAWLPYLRPTDDPRTVYVVHQYEPQDQYTHQEPGSGNTYPGMLDTDWDGQDDQFDRAWLDNLLSTVDTFVATHGVPVSVDEYGVNRWVPGGAEFMDDQMDLFEQRGMNQALWEWQTSWEPFAEDVHDMTYRLGPDPDNRAEVPNDLMDVIVKYWGRNTVRPSTFAAAK